MGKRLIQQYCEPAVRHRPRVRRLRPTQLPQRAKVQRVLYVARRFNAQRNKRPKIRHKVRGVPNGTPKRQRRFAPI